MRTVPPILEAQDIRKDFPGVRALDRVDFQLRPGEIHALVGENGAGKSTLIKILTGEYPVGTFEGMVVLQGHQAHFHSVRDSRQAGIAAVHQELALVDDLTVGENVLLGDEPTRFGLFDWERLYEQAEAVLAILGIDIDVREDVRRLGVGEQQLVEIARALRRNDPILLLDEPTAALAGNEVRILLDLLSQLREQGIAIIYISHKLDEVFTIADRITVLRDGNTIASKPTDEWSQEAVVAAMVGREQEATPTVNAPPAGDVRLEVCKLGLHASTRGGHPLLQDVSFTVRAGEILGIAGLMGAGRTELLSTIFGAAPGPWQGEVRVAGNPIALRSPEDAVAAGLALVPEDRKADGLILPFSVLTNLSLAHLDDISVSGVIDQHREVTHGEKLVADLGIRTPSLHAETRTLSGGNQQKTVLGKWLMREPKVLLLDEPTRGVDVGAKDEIHRLIAELTSRGMAVVMASSELPELLQVSDRIVVLRRGRIAGEFTRAEATPEAIMACAT